jgi:hypothetical protein
MVVAAKAEKRHVIPLQARAPIQAAAMVEEQGQHERSGALIIAAGVMTCAPMTIWAIELLGDVAAVCVLVSVIARPPSWRLAAPLISY